MTLVDTSALYALLHRDDSNHRAAVAYLRTLPGVEGLVTHNYVALESTALVQRRLGHAAARALVEGVLSALDVRWVDREVHEAAVSAMLAAARRRGSLVDYVSFEVMRRDGIRRAFAFDRGFALQGFEVFP